MPAPPSATASRPLLPSPSPAALAIAVVPAGKPLPREEDCARLVRPTPEYVPENTPYNMRRGTHRLPGDFFDPGSHNSAANRDLAPRVTGNFTGTTHEIMQWVACKWGINEKVVRTQAWMESSWRQTTVGDWTGDAAFCVPGHGLGLNGVRGECPESWGLLQVRYRYLKGAFPDAINSTAFNVDTAYAIWRACYEGYEEWLGHVHEETPAPVPTVSSPPKPPYAEKGGDGWGCIGRWYAGAWYNDHAIRYMTDVQRAVDEREPG